MTFSPTTEQELSERLERSERDRASWLHQCNVLSAENRELKGKLAQETMNHVKTAERLVEANRKLEGRP